MVFTWQVIVVLIVWIGGGFFGNVSVGNKKITNPVVRFLVWIVLFPVIALLFWVTGLVFKFLGELFLSPLLTFFGWHLPW